ncbi:MAG TPA: glycosyltransferase family 39 protein [Gemmatimonadaceae bacterium]|nr:glycosyltransferase family 39 protein [Gemmatimonadaceae bacterium]
MTDTKTAWWIICLAGVFRLVMAAIVPIVPDEAYYWEWSRHLAAGYFDHPPAIAVLIRAGTLIAGDTPFGVRCVAVLVGTLATVAAVALAQRFGGVVAAQRAAWAVLAMPLAGAGLVLATPDVPLLAALSIGLLMVDHALSSTRPIVWWIAAGLSLGCGLESKYTAVLFGAGIVLALLARKDLREQWRRPGPYVAILVATLVFLPVVFWNAGHDWISFRFQLQHGLVPKGHSNVFNRELSLLGGQLGLVSPILFVLIVLAVARGLRRVTTNRVFVVAAVAAFIAVFFVYSAARRSVEPNWLAPAVLAGTIVWGAERVITTRWERAGLALGIVLVAAIYVQVIVPFLPLPARRDPTAQGGGWASLAREIDGVRQGAWVATNRYQDAAELAFHLNNHPTVFSLNIGGRPNEYDLWPQLSERARAGDTVLVVVPDESHTPDAIVALLPHCRSMARGDTVELRRGREVIGARRIWTCAGWITAGTPLPRAPVNSST